MMTLNEFMDGFIYDVKEANIAWVEVYRGQWGYFDGSEGWIECEAWDDESWREAAEFFDDEGLGHDEVIDWFFKETELDDGSYYITVKILLK